MKYCVTCQKSNLGRKFIDGQCETCFDLNPIPQVVYVRPEKRCEICDKPMKSVCLYCKRSKEEVDRILNPKPVKIKVKKVKKHPCFLCGLEETPNNLFKDRPKKNSRYVHVKCIEHRINVKKPIERKAPGRPLTTMLERMSNLPDFKICGKCEEEKHITKFYIKKGYVMNWCKKCHNGRTRKWALDNRKDVLEYHRNYNKNYKRKKK